MPSVASSGQSADTLIDQIAAITMPAMRYLLRSRRDWTGTVTSAEVLLALQAVGLGAHVLTTDGVTRFAAGQVSGADLDGSWEGDFDATAHGILVAAAFPGAFDAGSGQRAAEHLLKSFGGTSLGWSWSDEIGKTLLALRALSAIRHPRLKDIALMAMPWLINHQHDGVLVNERYTAEFLAARREIEGAVGPMDWPAHVEEEFPIMEEVLLRSCQSQLSASGQLWNNDPRANGIVLEVLAPKLASESPHVIRTIIAWFRERQLADASFGTDLETARIVQGLSQLALQLAQTSGLSGATAQRRVADAHRGLAEGIPLAVLWQPMRWSHDTARQARVLVVPDVIWRRTAWAFGVISGGLLLPLAYDLLKAVLGR